MKKTSVIVRDSIIIYCIIFTVAMLANSIAALANGDDMGYHSHVLLLAAVCVAIAVVYGFISVLFENIKQRDMKTRISIYVLIGVACAAVLLLIAIFIWARDLFINITIVAAVAAVVVAGLAILRRWSKKAKEKELEDNNIIDGGDKP